MLKKEVKIICVLRASNVYDSEYVTRLQDQAAAYAPGVPFVCISNVEVKAPRIPMKHMWPGWWCKMELFRPDIKGDLFFIDLDSVICGEIWDLLNVDKFTMLSDFYRPDYLASGLMYIPEAVRANIWTTFTKQPHYWMNKFKRIGDQGFLEHCCNKKANRWQEEFPKRVVSYKAHKLYHKGVPEGAGVICFHGSPKPRDVGWYIKGLPELPKRE